MNNRTKLTKITKSRIALKICGLSNIKDIDFCYKSGVDAVGFLLGNSNGEFPTDKLSIKQTNNLIQTMPKGLLSFVLIKEFEYEKMYNILASLDCDVIQLQKDPSVLTLTKLRKNFPKLEWVKTIKMQPDYKFDDIANIILKYVDCVDAFLLDSPMGGSGKTHNWNLSRRVSGFIRDNLGLPIILAGGLNKDNIIYAIDSVNPSMLDIMSGASLSRGIKDHDSINEIVKKIKSINNA